MYISMLGVARGGTKTFTVGGQNLKNKKGRRGVVKVYFIKNICF